MQEEIIFPEWLTPKARELRPGRVIQIMSKKDEPEDELQAIRDKRRAMANENQRRRWANDPEYRERRNAAKRKKPTWWGATSP